MRDDHAAAAHVQRTLDRRVVRTQHLGIDLRPERPQVRDQPVRRVLLEHPVLEIEDEVAEPPVERQLGEDVIGRAEPHAE
jgi:hypothetical protein